MRADIEHEVSHDAKNSHFTTVSAHTKMAADKRGQIEVFGRIYTNMGLKNKTLGFLFIYGIEN